MAKSKHGKKDVKRYGRIQTIAKKRSESITVIMKRGRK